jgi:hypothetical protein
LVSALLALSVSFANAASVAPQAGTVLVNPGGGYAQIYGATLVPPAAKVLVSPGSSAVLSYSETCSVVLTEGVWDVLPAAPCGDGAETVGQAAPVTDAPASGGGVNTSVLIVGGLVAGGAVAVGLALSGSDKPASN